MRRLDESAFTFSMRNEKDGFGQCDQIWRNFDTLKIFGTHLKRHFLFGKILNYFGKNFMFLGKFSLFTKYGQILKNYPAIWSPWFWAAMLCAF